MIESALSYENFLKQIAVEYPKTAKENDVRALIIPSLIAPVALELPKQWWDEAERLVFLFHNTIRDHKGRSEELRLEEPVIPRLDNASVLMSYDFHVAFTAADGSPDPVGHLKMIEINTNASLSLLIDLMNSERALRPQCENCRRFKDELLDDFEMELGRPLTGARVAIVDDSPSKQKMFIEFLLYRELFEARGAEARILDRNELEMRGDGLWAKDFGPIDLVYNRTTDFYFSEPASRALREALVSRSAVITPGPFDYRMLADKDRMVEWSRESFLENTYGLSNEDANAIRAALIRTREVKNFDPELLWKERKSLMFKPRHAFGGKGVFRGSSISRGAFEGMLASDSLAQDFVPAPTTKVDAVEFKYDLRFFAYRDRLHAACARLYQGQTTNATTPGGGVAQITWR